MLQQQEEYSRKLSPQSTISKKGSSPSQRKKSPGRQVISSYSQRNFPKINHSSPRTESPTNMPPFYNYNNGNK